MISYLSPTGMLGAGFSERYFIGALERDIAFIGCDAGSCDGGPGYLGANRFLQSRRSVMRDLRLLLIGARRKGIPLLIGSCGGSGGNWNVAWVWDIVREIAAAEDLHFTVALIEAEPDRGALARKWRQGRIRPLDAAPPVGESTFFELERIVAMMGAEAYQTALAAGANVVLAGRSTDASIFAALPLREGYDPGLCWHAAKILECGGGAVAEMERPEGMLCTIREDHFVVEPVSPRQRCTPLSVAAHALYESGDPFLMHEPGGVLDLRGARYTAVDERRVAVRGSVFRSAPYTVRLEGARFAGHQAMALGGVRDPVLLAGFDAWLETVRTGIADSAQQAFGATMERDFQVLFRVYGRDAVLGRSEPHRDTIGHEIGLAITILAGTQEQADGICALAAHMALHHAVPAWSGLVSNLAFPIAPHVVALGPAYRFALNHVAELDDPLEFFPIRYERL